MKTQKLFFILSIFFMAYGLTAFTPSIQAHSLQAFKQIHLRMKSKKHPKQVKKILIMEKSLVKKIKRKNMKQLKSFWKMVNI